MRTRSEDLRRRAAPVVDGGELARKGGAVLVSGAICLLLFALNFIAYRSPAGEGLGWMFIPILALTGIYGMLASGIGLFMVRSKRK